MFRIFVNIFVSLFGFGSFIYITLLSVYRLYFDYERNMLRTSTFFVLASVLALLVTNTVVSVEHTQITSAFVSLGITLVLMGVFSYTWQLYGKHLMPDVPIRKQIVTLYDFTPRFAVTKFFEISFQNILAYILVVSVHAYTQNIITTIVVFGVSFFVTHLLTVSFFGKQWGVFMGIMAPVGGVVVVVGYLLVPNGIIYVISFHILMYLFFLIVLRRLALRRMVTIN